MNGCFTMGFLGTDLEMETGLQSLRDAPACVGRQGGAEWKRALNIAALEASGQCYKVLWSWDDPAQLSQLKPGFVPLQQSDTGPSPAGWTLGQAAPSAVCQQWPILPEFGDGTSDLKEQSIKKIMVLPTKGISDCSKHHQVRFQTRELLIQTFKTQDTL